MSDPSLQFPAFEKPNVATLSKTFNMIKSSLIPFFAAIILLQITAIKAAPAQSPINAVITNQPEKAIIYTNDINNFWVAFDSLTAGYKKNPFNDFYIKKGSNGVQHFMDHNRIVNADTLLATVINRKQDYLKIRDNSLKINEVVMQCRVSYFALKYLYPKAVFPPLYFVIGRFNTGGVSLPNEQIIGAEMNEPGNIPYMVAHELIHANQKIPYKYKILLEQCIIEGSADFLGELISGKIASTAPYLYAKGKEKELMKEFLRDMNLGENDDFDYWLYSGPRKDDRPADMGYYIGYVITKAYYDKAIDKNKAIADILNIRDCKVFLRQSGYISQVESVPEKNKSIIR